jgi:two-component system chemotaxis response regulator CheB
MNAEPLRILIVDDSRIFRSVIEQALADCPDVKVVGSVWSGEKALEFARQSAPDFVTLDINMPGLGGLETLKTLRAMSQSLMRPIGVLLVSAYTKRGAAVTIEGLQEGAFDFITKPDGPDAKLNAAVLRAQLLEKVTAFRSRRAGVPVRPIVAQRSPATTTPARRQVQRFQAIVIGASTGGPEALTRLLPVIARACPVPIFLVQHMPAGFTDYFATSLSRRCGSSVVEAQEGAIPGPSQVFVAPGGKHLMVHVRAGKAVIGLSDSPPENGCRPAADVLFRSAAAAYSGEVLAVVLTGMGSDGAKGAVALKQAGAHVVVQDEATSVVWGMPGSTVAAGAADEVLPLDEIGPAVRRHLELGD